MKEIKEKIVGQRVLPEDEKSSLRFHESALHATYPKEVADKLCEEIDNELPTEVVKEVKRPRRIGNTWRLKPPYAEHALYVTIEAITIAGKKYPYEVFFHGKDISHRQWTDTLTLSWSEAFRKAIEYGFSLTSLVANVQDTNSAEGGYRVALRVGDKPTYVKGLVSEIGYVLEEFVTECLAFNYANSSHENPPTIEEAKSVRNLDAVAFVPEWKQALPDVHKIAGSKCSKCGEFAVVKEGGCEICKDCGDSRCS